jgi:hypothetical protein
LFAQRRGFRNGIEGSLCAAPGILSVGYRESHNPRGKEALKRARRQAPSDKANEDNRAVSTPLE